MEREILYISEAFSLMSKLGIESQISEDVNNPGREVKHFVYEGEFSRANFKNGNIRVYTDELLNRETDKLGNMCKVRNGIAMELDHPLPGNDPKDMILAKRASLKNAGGLLVQLEMNGEKVYGKSKILNNIHGQTLRSMVEENNWLPAVSSRGVGPSARPNAQGTVYVPNGYRQVTYDYVSNPSHHNAVLSAMIAEELEYNDFVKNTVPERNLWNVLADISNKF